MGNIDNLRTIAQIIQRESQDGANTAERVGSLLVDVIDELGAAETSISNVESRIIGGSSFAGLRNSVTQLQNDLRDLLRRLGLAEKDIDDILNKLSGEVIGDLTFDEVKEMLTQLQSDLNNVLDRNREGITQMINSILEGKHFVDGWQSGWDENIRAYLIQAGILNENGSKGWSYLSVKTNEIEAAVNRLLTAFDDGEGRILGYEAIQALIKQYIDDNNHAIIELLSKYALTDAENNVLKWLTAGFRSEAAADKAVAEVFASMENVNSAIALLRTEVTEDFVAKASLTTQVNNLINNRIYTAGFITESTLDGALATIFATDNDVTAAITAKVQSGISIVEITADNINAITKNLAVKMNQLLLGNDEDLLIRTTSDTEVPGQRYPKLEILLGEFEPDGQGGYNPKDYNACNRIIMNMYYADINKLFTSHLLVGSEYPSTDKMDISKSTTIRWFERIGRLTENHTIDGVTYYAGDQGGFGGAAESTFNVPSGSITFNGDTVTITGKLHVTGGVV